MSITVQIALSAALLVVVGAPSLYKTHRDYQSRGKLSLPGMALLLLAWGLQGMLASLAIWRDMNPAALSFGLLPAWPSV